MTRIEYFLAWPPERLARLTVDQEAQIKLLKELLAEYRAALVAQGGNEMTITLRCGKCGRVYTGWGNCPWGCV